MSFTDDSGLGLEPEGQPNEDPGNQTQQEITLSPYAQNFLATQVPEEHREIVKPIVHKWDQGFNKYSQQVKGQLRQYSELGDYDTLKNAKAVYQRLLDDPYSVADWLAERGITPRQAQQMAQAAQGQNSGQQDDPILNHPKFQELMQQNERMNRALGLVAEQQKQFAERAQQEQADRELDEYLTAFKSTYKGVPEQFVLAYLNAGVTDMQVIAQQWQQTIQGHINSQQANRPPNVMGSSSQAPARQDATNMTPDQRREAFLSHVGKLLSE